MMCLKRYNIFTQFLSGGGGVQSKKISLLLCSLVLKGGRGLTEFGTMSLHMDFFFIEGIPNPNLHCSGTPLKHSFSGAFQIHACPGSLKQKVSYKKSRNPNFKKEFVDHPRKLQYHSGGYFHFNYFNLGNLCNLLAFQN